VERAEKKSKKRRFRASRKNMPAYSSRANRLLDKGPQRGDGGKGKEISPTEAAPPYQERGLREKKERASQILN